jgi:hypothetical protein
MFIIRKMLLAKKAKKDKMALKQLTKVSKEFV